MEGMHVDVMNQEKWDAAQLVPTGGVEAANWVPRFSCGNATSILQNKLDVTGRAPKILGIRHGLGKPLAIFAYELHGMIEADGTYIVFNIWIDRQL